MRLYFLTIFIGLFLFFSFTGIVRTGYASQLTQGREEMQRLANTLTSSGETASIVTTPTATSPGSTPGSTPEATPGSMLPAPTITPTLTAIPTSIITVSLYVPVLLAHTEAIAGRCGSSQFAASTSTVESLRTPTPLTSTTGVTEPVAALTVTVCPPSQPESTLAELIFNSPRQQRTSITYNPTLTQVARNHALDMAERGFFGPTDPDGIGPNYRVREAGYLLVSQSGEAKDANNIETTMAGYRTAEDVWAALDQGNGNDHVLGLREGYRTQTEYGIGHLYIEESLHKSYWVILIAQPEE